MKVDHETYLDAVRACFDLVSSGGDGWHKIRECPFCGSKWSLGVHPTKGFICHDRKCGQHGTSKGFVRVIRAAGYEIDLPFWSGLPDRTDLASELEDLLEAGDETLSEERIDVPLPPSVPISNRVPAKWMRRRGFSESVLLHPALNLQVCIAGGMMNRIIFPLFGRLAPYHSAYLGYAVPQDLKPKVRYPKGCKISRFMWPIHILSPSRPILLLEGVTDVLRVMHFQSTFQPVALLGKTMSKHHRRSLVDLDPTEVCVCLDADAEMDQRKIVDRLCSVLGHSRVSFIEIGPWVDSPTGDPCDVRSPEIWAQIEEARKPGMML